MITVLVMSVGAVALLMATSAKQASGVIPSKGLDPRLADLMNPGPEHQQIAKTVGTWDVDCSFWKGSNEAPIQSKGEIVYVPLFDGRFTQGTFTGMMMGQKFIGHSLMGYNRASKQYLSTWYDNMGTGITSLTGSSADNGKTITYSGEMTCPMNGKVQLRHVENHQSDASFTVTSYQIKDGKEQKTMELVHARRQPAPNR
jgi:hypothetical protein